MGQACVDGTGLGSGLSYHKGGDCVPTAKSATMWTAKLFIHPQPSSCCSRQSSDALVFARVELGSKAVSELIQIK